MPATIDTPPDTASRDDGRWWSQLRELFVSRYELAELEIRGDIDNSRRLGVVGGSGLVMALAGLPVLVMVLGEALGAATVIDAVWWQLGIGIALLLIGLIILWFSYRKFRRDFAGLRETLEELRDDAAWMKEMAAEFMPMFAIRPAGDEESDAS